MGDAAAARADIDKGLALVPADPFGWYLSAALARRQGDLVRARKDIAKAVELAPAEASILLEAGNVAGLAGDIDAAKAHFARAAAAAPGSDAARSAQAALAANHEAPAAPNAPK
jgi:Tfp pilus assembly protein PilF